MADIKILDCLNKLKGKAFKTEIILYAVQKMRY